MKRKIKLPVRARVKAAPTLEAPTVKKKTVKASLARKTVPKAATTLPSDDFTADFCRYEWLELHPKGIVFEGNHFVFLLEDEAKKIMLPLRFPLQSADLLSVPNLKSLWKKSLTTLQGSLFKEWDISLTRCAFFKQDSGRHRVKLFYSKDGQERFLEQDLENVLGMCLEGALPFYATRAYIQDSQVATPANENFIIENQKWTGALQKYLM